MEPDVEIGGEPVGFALSLVLARYGLGLLAVVLTLAVLVATAAAGREESAHRSPTGRGTCSSC